MVAPIYFAIAIGNGGDWITAPDAVSLAQGVTGSAFNASRFESALAELIDRALVESSAQGFRLTVLGRDTFQAQTANCPSVKDAILALQSSLNPTCGA
jgi:hypothetical protein